MKKGRRVLAVVVALCMVLGVVVCPPDVKRVRAEVSGDYQYRVLDDGSVEITGYVGSDTKLEIPREIDGKLVKHIGDRAFSGCSGLIEIVIPDGVISIGGSAFYDCSGLTKIAIPDGMTSIEDAVFFGCSGLTEIVIPDSVTNIGRSAFVECSGLTEIAIPDGLLSIEKSVFYACSGLTEIAIPDSVISIGDEAFSVIDRQFYR